MKYFCEICQEGLDALEKKLGILETNPISKVEDEALPQLGDIKESTISEVIESQKRIKVFWYLT